MLKLFSAHNPSISPIDKEADFSLCWNGQRNNTFLPVIAEIGGNKYMLIDASHETDSCILVKQASYKDAIELSINITGADKLSFTDWVRIYDITHRFNVDIYALPLPYPKEKESFVNLLSKATSWSKELLDYLENRPVPFKTLQMAARLDSTYLTGFVSAEKPSMQSFKNFVETATDFKDILPQEYNGADFSAITERRGAKHIKAGELLKMLQSKTVSASVADAFETGALRWQLNTASAAEFDAACDYLQSLKQLVHELYDIIDGDEN